MGCECLTGGTPCDRGPPSYSVLGQNPTPTTSTTTRALVSDFSGFCSPCFKQCGRQRYLHPTSLSEGVKDKVMEVATRNASNLQHVPISLWNINKSKGRRLNSEYWALSDHIFLVTKALLVPLVSVHNHQLPLLDVGN